MASAPIIASRTTTDSQPEIDRKIEKDTQTFQIGVPVQIDNGVAGGVKEWDGTTIAGGIAGFSTESGASLTTTGVAKHLSYGSVPNQSAAVNIPRGAPLNDGRTGYYVANQNTVFHGQVKSDQLFANTDVGKQYGMTKDTDNHWYVDKTKTTTSGAQGASEAVVVIVDGDEYDTRGVYFRVLDSAAQLVAA